MKQSEYNRIMKQESKILSIEEKLNLEEDNLRILLDQYNINEIEFSVSVRLGKVLVGNQYCDLVPLDLVLQKIKEKGFFEEKDLQFSF